jgi:LysM domain
MQTATTSRQTVSQTVALMQKRERRVPGALNRQDAPGAPDEPPLRLTRRGRIVVAALVALLVTAVSAMSAGAAEATNHQLPRSVAERNLVQVTVRPGQSLWSVAEAADPDADTRVVIHEIIGFNTLSGEVLYPGEQLWVPRG